MLTNVIASATFGVVAVTATDVDQGPLAWREAGEGEVVVLLHGLGGSRTAWRPQLEGLSAERRVVAWDLPGYGASSPLDGPLTFSALADAVVRLLDALATDRAHAVRVVEGCVLGDHPAHREADHVRPVMEERAVVYDREATFPWENFHDFRERGLLGLCIPESHGGLGASFADYVRVSEEIGRHCGATGLTFNMHVGPAVLLLRAVAAGAPVRRRRPRRPRRRHGP